MVFWSSVIVYTGEVSFLGSSENELVCCFLHRS